MFAFWDPKLERRHKMTLWKYSGLKQNLADVNFVNRVQYCFYFDSAYFIRSEMLVKFINNTENAQ